MKTEDEMVGWHHCLSGREFEQTLGENEGRGSLMCCGSCGRTRLVTEHQQQQCCRYLGSLMLVTRSG